MNTCDDKTRCKSVALFKHSSNILTIKINGCTIYLTIWLVHTNRKTAPFGAAFG